MLLVYVYVTKLCYHVQFVFSRLGLQIQGLWEKLTESLNNIGIGTYELFYNREPRLAHELGANTYPQFIGVVAGRNIRYKNEMSERYIRDFLATILPHHMITNVSVTCHNLYIYYTEIFIHYFTNFVCNKIFTSRVYKVNF